MTDGVPVNLRDAAELEREITREIQEWCEANIVGVTATTLTVEAVVAHLESVFASTLPAGYRGFLLNPRFEPGGEDHGATFVADGVRIEQVDT